MVRCVLFAIVTLACAVLAGVGTSAHAQPPTQQDVGYLEGRILELTPSQPGGDIAAGGTATVRLSDGSQVTATVPPAEMFGVTEIEPFAVGDRVELYFSPAPGGGRDIVVVDWIRRPTLLWLTGLFLLVSVAVARLKGLRAFVATGASLAIVITFIVPRILDGWNPMVVSMVGRAASSSSPSTSCTASTGRRRQRSSARSRRWS